MDSVDAPDGASGREDHPEDDHDAEQDEGVGPEGAILQVFAGQCLGHGRRLPAVLHAPPLPHPPPPPVAHPSPRSGAPRPTYARGSGQLSVGRGRFYAGHIR